MQNITSQKRSPFSSRFTATALPAALLAGRRSLIPAKRPSPHTPGRSRPRPAAALAGIVAAILIVAFPVAAVASWRVAAAPVYEPPALAGLAVAVMGGAAFRRWHRRRQYHAFLYTVAAGAWLASCSAEGDPHAR